MTGVGPYKLRKHAFYIFRRQHVLAAAVRTDTQQIPQSLKYAMMSALLLWLEVTVAINKHARRSEKSSPSDTLHLSLLGSLASL